MKQLKKAKEEHKPCKYSEDQRVSSDCRTEANDDTLGMLEPFKTEFYSLIYKSISKKTWKVYKNAKNTLEDFREKN